AQAGLMVVGVGLDGPAGMAAGMTFVVQDVLAKGALFLVLAAAADIETDGRDLARVRPVLATVLIVILVSLAGLPLTSGFVGKALIVRAALDGGEIAVAVLVLIGSLLVLVAGCRLLLRTVWDPVEADDMSGRISLLRRRWAVVPAAVLAVLVLAVGAWPAWLGAPVEAASSLLSDPATYAEEVLR
ncbi:MAG: proton-conducting transporter membrane subunit, partial [Nitriliruptorales bacterium]|nr:proton-conducting transporter membrane subunit [Nitriliruptorales bacterium]